MISQAHRADLVRSTDRWGRNLIDGIWMGCDYVCRFTCLEWRTGALNAILGLNPAIFQIGAQSRRLYDNANSHVFTAVTGSPAQTLGLYNSITLAKATPAPDFQSQWAFGPQLRMVPIELITFLQAGSPNFYGSVT